MWFLFHRKAQTKAVAGGDVLREHCPVCKRATRFVEVEVSEKLGVWFVDVFDDKERKFCCTECGETFDRVIEPDDAPVTEQVPLVDKVDLLAAEQRRRDASKAQLAARLDDELAALKRRMGRA